MKNLITIAATFVLFGIALLAAEQHRRSEASPKQSIDSARALLTDRTNGEVIRAAGRIEGRTDKIELRARLAEQVRQIHVRKGEWVSEGDVLLSLDADRYRSERDLAEAMLTEAEAKKQRLENGARPTEIETARQEYQATLARLAWAENSHQRAIQLAVTNAVSHQEIDDRRADVDTWRATSIAASKRLETLQLPPRDDDLLAASAAVRAAKSRLELAQIDLDRSQVKAPTDGEILAIEVEVGELTRPDSEQPLIIMSDTSRLRVVAEIDEYDALSVDIGQACQVTSDGAEGILAVGMIAAVEPQMNPKAIFGQWAGERTDTFSRRVWIDLEKPKLELPIGLPVDVFIETFTVE